MDSESFKWYLLQTCDYGNKIELPISVLENYLFDDDNQMMLFRLSYRDKFTYCSVLEFTSKEEIGIPKWIVQLLELESDNCQITFESVQLSKGKLIKVQPQSSDFLQIEDQKSALESGLRFYSCLSQGDIIPVYIQGKIYQLKILLCQPEEYISIIDVDLEVQIDTPSDYVPPTYKKIRFYPPTEKKTESSTKFIPFSGKGNRLI